MPNLNENDLFDREMVDRYMMEEQHPDERLENLVIHSIEQGFIHATINKNKNQSSENKYLRFLKDVVLYTDRSWIELTKYIKTHYGTMYARYTSLIILYQQWCTDQTYLQEPYKEYANIALQSYLDSIDIIVSDEDIKKGDPQYRKALLKEYFELFRKLGTFKTDISAYETDEERNIHTRLINIYMDLTDQSF